MNTRRLLPLPILMLNIVTQPLYWILMKLIDNRLADKIFAKMEEK